MPQGGWSYTQPETGVSFHSTNLNAVRDAVQKHRRAVGIEMPFDWYQRWLDELCTQNPHLDCINNPEAEGYEQPHAIIGRALWLELHAKALTHKDDPDASIQTWFGDWLNRVPNYSGCKCRENFTQIMGILPPDFSQGGFYRWSVRAHDLVNVKLGKKTSVEFGILAD